MNAPDKIYLLKVELEERWPGITEASELNPEKEECYIRKDALLEWVKGEIMPGNSAEGKGWNMAMQTLIDKIESL